MTVCYTNALLLRWKCGLFGWCGRTTLYSLFSCHQPPVVFTGGILISWRFCDALRVFIRLYSASLHAHPTRSVYLCVQYMWRTSRWVRSSDGEAGGIWRGRKKWQESSIQNVKKNVDKVCGKLVCAFIEALKCYENVGNSPRVKDFLLCFICWWMYSKFKFSWSDLAVV